MQLNLTTDYAIRIILYLAMEDEVTNSGSIAQAMCISQKYIVNTIHKLKTAGLIVAYPGVNGGYKLGKRPSEISMLEIIVAMEGTTKLNRCMENDGFCSRSAAATCPIRRFYVNIQKAVEDQLSKTSIEHMIQN